MFCDDAYNKNVLQTSGDGGAGTLIGNWFEERVLRDATGEGRTVPQRHVPRSGLLQDFTKLPGQYKKGDDTFSRVYGPKSDFEGEPASRAIGAPDQHAGKILGVGPKETMLHSGRMEVAQAEVQLEEEELAKQAQVRRWETTTGFFHSKPDELQAEKAAYTRKGYIPEIKHGPVPERTRGIDNRGLNVPSHAHYTNMEPVTHARVALDHPRLSSDVKVTAASGMQTFGINSEFTKPMLEFTRGLAKDEELEMMYSGLKSTEPLRHIGGHQPRGPFAEVPSLATVKAMIHSKVGEVWGAYGYVLLRQRLFDVGDQEGFVQKDDLKAILRNDLGLDSEANDLALDVYLSQLATIKKTHLRIGGFVSSLRPVMTQKQKRHVLQVFKSFGPVNGEIRLGDWFGQVPDETLRNIVVKAFGALEESEVEGMGISEQVFMELLSDLAPFIDIEELLCVEGVEPSST